MTQQDRDQMNRLMLEYSDGNKESYEKFCEMFYQYFYNFIEARTNDAHLAKDLTQELFLKVQKIDFSKRSFDNVPGYFCKVAESRIRNHLLKKQRLREVELTENIRYYDEYEDAVFYDLTNGLSERELRILDLRFIQGYSLEEAAKIVGLGKTTVSLSTSALKQKILKNKDALQSLIIFLLFACPALLIAAA